MTDAELKEYWFSVFGDKLAKVEIDWPDDPECGDTTLYFKSYDRREAPFWAVITDRDNFEVFLNLAYKPYQYKRKFKRTSKKETIKKWVLAMNKKWSTPSPEAINEMKGMVYQPPFNEAEIVVMSAMNELVQS